MPNHFPMINVETRWTTKRFSRLPQVAGLSPALIRILLSRGVTPERMPDFINGGVSLIRPSVALPAVTEAVARIREALAKGMAITIVGDYDVDGITASVLLYEVLNELGTKAEIIIPDRRRDGYGISVEIVERIANGSSGKSRLIITVDNGSNAREAIARAFELGLEVIVTDHHAVTDPPESVVMVNPNNPCQPYVFKGLSGVGVAWKIARELLDSVGHPQKAWHYLDLVALGTIADVSPLIDENRALVKLGLQQLSHQCRPGIKELIKLQLAHRLNQQDANTFQDSNKEMGLNLTAYDVGMYLTPCLNAAGRIGDVQDAVNLLLCQDPPEASRIANSLVALNQERKLITEQGVKAAIDLMPQEEGIPKIICLPLPDLDESICGLVAGRIKDAFYRPTLVFTRTRDKGWKGSGRSVAGFDLTSLLKSISYLKGGGHSQACGFHFASEDVDAFLQAVKTFSEDHLPLQQFTRVIPVDLPVEPSEVTPALVREIKQLEPFGAGWEEPVIGLRGVSVSGGPMGKNGDHLRLRCDRSGLVFKGWGKYEQYQLLGCPRIMDIIGRVRCNLWNNRVFSEVEILDFRANIDKA